MPRKKVITTSGVQSPPLTLNDINTLGVVGASISIEQLANQLREEMARGIKQLPSLLNDSRAHSIAIAHYSKAIRDLIIAQNSENLAQAFTNMSQEQLLEEVQKEMRKLTHVE